MNKRKLLKPVYFLTWTTYGTWVSGDNRGSKSRKPSPFGFPNIQPNPQLVRFCENEMKEEEYLLDREKQQISLSAIKNICEKSSWKLIAVQIRTNHIHLILQVDSTPALKALKIIKTSISRTMNMKFREKFGTIRWTRGGYFKLLDSEDRLKSAIHYVINEQGNKLTYYISPEYEYLLS